MKRVQRGFHRFGIISAVATLLLGVALGSWVTMVSSTDYNEVTAEKLSRIVAVDCKTGTPQETDPAKFVPPLPPLPPGFELDISCIELGDGETLQFPPNTYSKQVEATKKLLGEREAVLKKIQERLFAKNVALTLGGSLLAALVVYGVFASLGWALAGFAKD